MTPRQLADRMKAFGIQSKTIRFSSGTAKGYMLEDMIDAFDRYAYLSNRRNSVTIPRTLAF